MPHKDIGVTTSLSDKIVQGMAGVSYQQREVAELRAHEKDAAKINASGPAKAEIVKWVLWAVATIAAVLALPEGTVDLVAR